MFRFGQKLQIFIFGLTVGLLIGFLFFIFKLDDYFAKISFSDNKTNTTIIEQVIPENTTAKNDLKEAADLKKPTPKSKPVTDSAVKENGSTLAFENSSLQLENQETINVLKEELVGVKNIYLKDFDNNRLYKSSKDSLLSVVSGVTEPKKNDFFMVEFWKTPLNSKGYKMTRNRVLIYGLTDKSDVALVKVSDNYYLKNNSVVYKLNYSTEFKPMERVTENNILEKF
jgi:hypothetical protein